MRNYTSRKRGRIAITGAVLIGGLVFVVPQWSRATVILNDNFSTSTLNSAAQSYPNSATPTSTSTNYDVAAAKVPASMSITGGDLHVSQAASSSEITEVEALFTSTPVVLTNVNDFIELTVTFTNTSGLLGNATSALYLGLDSASQVAPYNNVNTATDLLSSTQTTSALGGAQGWSGYTNVALGSGGSLKTLTRPAQTSTKNVNQDVVSAGASGSQSYKTPAAVQLTSANSASTLALTTGNVYTGDFLITLTSPGTYTVVSSYYNGSTATGSPIGTVTGTDTALLANGFDALAFGWRDTQNTAATTMDVSQILVQTNVTVPEPASIGLLGVAVATLLRRRRA